MSSFEIKIRDLLFEKKDVEKVVLSLLEESKDNPRHLRSIAQLALNSGYKKSLAACFVTWLRKAPVVPWAQYIELLGSSGLKPDKELLLNLIAGAKLQNGEHRLSRSHAWDKATPQLKKLREIHSENLSKKYSSRNQAIKDKIVFLRSQRLIEEENKAIAQLQREYPEDSELPSLLASFEDRWARHVLSRSRNHSQQMQSSYSLRQPELSAEETNFVDTISSECTQMCKKDNSYAYDFTLLFYFIGQPKRALQVLELAPASEGKDWLMLELLFEAGHYISCLEYLKTAEASYADHPEGMFAISYMRAQTLWALGHKEEASELMEHIIQLRPQYRSAQALMNEWAHERGLP